jgi:uncharacterized protein (TIGR03435 family)
MFVAALAVLISGQAQTSENVLSFEAASVKLHPRGVRGDLGLGTGVRVGMDGKILRMRTADLYELILFAFPHTLYSQIKGVPDDFPAYDIDAVASSPASESQMRAMLWTLLAERFHLIVRHETREVAGYALVVSSGFGGEQVPAHPPSRAITTMSPGSMTQDFPAATMDDFANHLAGLMNRTVVNETKLEGAYRFQITIARTQPLAGSGGGGDLSGDWGMDVGLANHGLAPLGLELKPKRVPEDNIVVQHVEKPTDN